jgi:hypothetical protein
MIDALNTKRTLRARILAVLLGAGSNSRSAEVTTAVAALVASGGLTACAGATFGLFAQPVGSNDCAIALGSKNLTSPRDLPWAAADVGKRIDVQGAGAAGATLSTRIAGFTSAGSITLQDDALTAVVASATSTGGIAVWGNPFGFSEKDSGLDANGFRGENLSSAANGGMRDVQTILNDEARIADYGGDPTGVLDSTDAFVAAAALGKTVKIGKGTWVLSQIALTGITGLNIVGEAGAILKMAALPTQTIQGFPTWILVDTCVNFNISGVKFDLNAIDATAVGIKGCTNGAFVDNEITNSPGTLGVSGGALLIHSSSAIKANRNYIHDVGSWVDFGLSTTVGQITDSEFCNNICKNSVATNAVNATRSVVSGNVFDTCGGAGLECAGVGTAMFDCVISNNTFKACTLPALQFAAVAAGGLTHSCIASNNTFDACLDAALYLFSDVRNIILQGNTIKNCVKGIVLTCNAGGGCSFITVKDNQIYDTRAGGARTAVNGVEMAMGTSGGGTLAGEVFADIVIAGNVISNLTGAAIVTTYTSGNGAWARIRMLDNVASLCDYGASIGSGNPVGLWASMELKRNKCANNVTAAIRLSIDAGDINTWDIEDNSGTLTYGTPYVIGGLGGVPAFRGMRSAGTPEAAIVAGIGSTCVDVAGGVGTTFYVKETATVNTGWDAK